MKTVQLYKSGQNHMTLKINTVKFEALQKALGIKFVTEIGILGASSHNRKATAPRMATERSASGKGHASQDTASTKTNAEIGAMMEYGVKNKTSGGWQVPPRSFLFVPLMMNLMNEVNKKADVFNKYLNMANIHKCYELLGISAENVVQNAFKVSGPGWDPNAPSTIARKGSAKPLIDTGQLRKSITSRVVA